MALDEQLISRNVQAKENVGNFNAARMRAKNGQIENESEEEDEEDLRSAVLKEKKNQIVIASKDKSSVSKISPASKATANLLRSAWQNLIPSWGLTLIWIDIHIFLSMVFGKNLFCSLGEEWLSKGVSNNVEGAKKAVGMTEGMAVGCLNFGCLLIVLAVLAVISMIITGLSNPLEEIKDIFKSLWCLLGLCRK